MTNKIYLSDKQKNYIHELAPIGQAPGLVKAIREGKTIVINGNGNEFKEHMLISFLKDIGCQVARSRRVHLVEFITPKSGRGGEK